MGEKESWVGRMTLEEIKNLKTDNRFLRQELKAALNKIEEYQHRLGERTIDDYCRKGNSFFRRLFRWVIGVVR
jgi:hypothetical protein